MSTIEKLLKYLPHKDIVKNGVLYLRRHYLTPRTWPFKIYLHLIARPDADRAAHCHPWSFFTIILWGGYWEAVYQNAEQLRGEKNPLVRWVGFLRCLYRPATHIHQIIKTPTRTWTLVIAGPTKYLWGFYDSDRFIPWNEYLLREDGAVPEPLPEDVIRK